MSENNVKKPVRSGSTCIAYIDDSTCNVGVVTREHADKVEILVLGHFTDRSNVGLDVFAPPFPYPFPSYRTVRRECVMSYDFKSEIALCKARASAWWKSQTPPCFPNLVARHFRPTHMTELQYIDATHHILRRGGINDFKGFGRLDEEVFLMLWAVLYGIFPSKTQKPPFEWDSPNSNTFFRIDIRETLRPTVTVGFRPAGYLRPEATS